MAHLDLEKFRNFLSQKFEIKVIDTKKILLVMRNRKHGRSYRGIGKWIGKLTDVLTELLPIGKLKNLDFWIAGRSRGFLLSCLG